MLCLRSICLSVRKCSSYCTLDRLCNGNTSLRSLSSDGPIVRPALSHSCHPCGRRFPKARTDDEDLLVIHVSPTLMLARHLPVQYPRAFRPDISIRFQGIVYVRVSSEGSTLCKDNTFSYIRQSITISLRRLNVGLHGDRGDAQPMRAGAPSSKTQRRSK